jgi:hypothetical protein
MQKRTTDPRLTQPLLASTQQFNPVGGGKKKETTSSSSSTFKSTASRFITADCEGQKRECSDPLRLQTKHTKMKKKKEVVSPFGPIHFQPPAAAAVFIVDAVIQIRGVLDYGVEEPTNTDPFPAVNEI